MPNRPIKLPVQLMQECEQALSHIQLSAACGDADGAAKRAERLLNAARKLRDTFLPSDHPRCDKCSEPLNAAELKGGDHCQRCALLLSMAAQVISIASKKTPVAAPVPVAVVVAERGLSPAATGEPGQRMVAAGESPHAEPKASEPGQRMVAAGESPHAEPKASEPGQRMVAAGESPHAEPKAQKTGKPRKPVARKKLDVSETIHQLRLDAAVSR